MSVSQNVYHSVAFMLTECGIVNTWEWWLMLMSNVIRGISGGGFSCCVSGTLLWINNIDLLYWSIDGVVISIDVCWPFDLGGLVRTRLDGTHQMSISCFFFSCWSIPYSPLPAGQWVRGQQGMLGYGNSEESTQSHTSERIRSYSDVWLELRAEAAVPEPTLEKDTGNDEMGPLSYVITGTQTGECVFVHASVCVCL